MKFYAGITLVTLGVDNVERASAFYEALGWRRSKRASQPSITFFKLNTLALALYPRDALAIDCGLDAEKIAAPGGFTGVTLAQNHGSKAAVDAVLEQARKTGARIITPPGDTDWGGYHGTFADPDGHIWEICFNPYFPLDADGSISLPP